MVSLAEICAVEPLSLVALVMVNINSFIPILIINSNSDPTLHTTL